MKIIQALFCGGLSAFYFDDQRAIKTGVGQDGFIYRGKTITPGFSRIRQAGESVSIILVLEDGSTAIGDCAAVQYSGAGGRDPLFLAESVIAFLEEHLRPLLEGREATHFLENARFFDNLKIDGRRLHTAIRYGVSQALLEAAARARSCLPTEVICAEYQQPLIAEPVPLFAQSGDDRYNAVDKMILKRVDALPHGLINNIPDKLGERGEKLIEYIRWLVSRINRLGEGYWPSLHIDVYGTIGLIFAGDAERVGDYLAVLGEAAGSLPLYIEGPVDAGSCDAQIEKLASIRTRLEHLGSPVKVVADEWCNTLEDIIAFTDARCCQMVQIKTPDLGSVHNSVEAVLYCRQHDMEAYQGGTCNETDLSARSCVHLALASRPQRMLVKPGMGFDEGMTIVGNEMRRTVALLKAKKLEVSNCNEAL